MKSVKIVVAIMTILIVIGLGLVAYGVGGRLSEDDSSMTPALVAHALVAKEAFGSIALGQPEGSHIHDIAASDGHLLVHIEGGGQGERIVVVDLANGVILGKLTLGSATQ